MGNPVGLGIEADRLMQWVGLRHALSSGLPAVAIRAISLNIRFAGRFEFQGSRCDEVSGGPTPCGSRGEPMA